ncbi:MAG: radical SAM protein [Deltaproteobacteria bacterium]|nr:radical SAM protein [Deltaproteobacteria bacterium]
MKCTVCGNECVIGQNEKGYCGLREKVGQTLSYGPQIASLEFYHDPLPTNCVADWVCAGGTGSGYPEFAYFSGPEYGYKNLAVFFRACSFNCLFCQNWHFRLPTPKKVIVTTDELSMAIDDKTSCVCFFGGDPSCQLPYAISFSNLAIKKKKGKILRICFETNGYMNPGLLDSAFNLSLKTGGCIKFDLKAYDRKIHMALTGRENHLTLRNFAFVAEKFKLRPEPPPVVASTLIIPGYVEEDEIANIAKFIAKINPDIPYAILAYYPHFYMNDLPLVSTNLAEKCLHAAKNEGLKRVRIGNVHLLC